MYSTRPPWSWIGWIFYRGWSGHGFLMHLPNGKSLDWDGLKTEVLKQYSKKLGAPNFNVLVLYEILFVCLKFERLASSSSFQSCHRVSYFINGYLFLWWGFNKAFMNVLTNRCQRYLPKLIHPNQYGFIARKNILHNVLNVKMGMDYGPTTHQQTITCNKI